MSVPQQDRSLGHKLVFRHAKSPTCMVLSLGGEVKYVLITNGRVEKEWKHMRSGVDGENGELHAQSPLRRVHRVLWAKHRDATMGWEANSSAGDAGEPNGYMV